MQQADPRSPLCPRTVPGMPHPSRVSCGFCRLQVCSFTPIHVLGQLAALGLARLAPLPLPPWCQEVSEGGQGGNRARGSSEYPSWALNSIRLHAAAPELLEAALGRGATGWGWSALQASGQGAGGRDGTRRPLCAGCRVRDGAKGSMCPRTCEFFSARSRAPEPGKATFELFQLQGHT